MIRNILLSFFILLNSFNAYAAISANKTPAETDPLVAEYQKFSSIMAEEKAAMGKQIHSTWGDRLLTTNRRWVAYMSDNARASYQFSTEKLTVELVLNSSVSKNKAISDASMRRYLRMFLMEDFQSIYERSPMAAAEKRMLTDGANIKTGTLSDTHLINLLDGDRSKNIALAIDGVINNVMKDGKRSYRQAPEDGKVILTLSAHVKADGLKAQQAKYMNSIEKYASNFAGGEDIVSAIAIVESELNPMAKSGAQAFGIMQVVPYTAGIEISKELFGEPTLLSPSYFFDTDRNIEAGVTYLSILYNNYFKGISNTQSRVYCVISAYNTGPSNVAKAFVGTKNISKAVEAINNMTPQEVYKQLIDQLPHAETRNYLKNVMAAAK